MDYLLTFLEGIASFISPCLLPMVPIYISYFIGESDAEEKKEKAFLNSIGFVIGFTVVFLVLAILATKFGNIISRYVKYIEVIFGIIIIILGFNYMGLLKLSFLNKTKGIKLNFKNFNFFKSILFGIMFSISWTPCIGTFLSSALLLIANNKDLVEGIILMILYSIGLGIPFIISSLLIEKLKSVFNFIKKNYHTVKIISGLILVFMGFYIIFF